jgi:hypothetical protein
MKKAVILLVMALEFAVCGCSYNTPRQAPLTQTAGNWEAQLINGTGQGSLLNFVVGMSVITGGGMDITGFAFFNQSACFSTGLTAQTETGNASFTTNNSTGQVVGEMTLTITSTTNDSVLKLTSYPNGFTGMSNGTLTSTGTLSNGVVVGNWTLSSKDPNCNNQNPNNTFIMCQGAATCTPPAAYRPDPAAEERWAQLRIPQSVTAF